MIDKVSKKKKKKKKKKQKKKKKEFNNRFTKRPLKIIQHRLSHELYKLV